MTKQPILIFRKPLFSNSETHVCYFKFLPVPCPAPIYVVNGKKFGTLFSATCADIAIRIKNFFSEFAKMFSGAFVCLFSMFEMPFMRFFTYRVSILKIIFAGGLLPLLFMCQIISVPFSGVTRLTNFIAKSFRRRMPVFFYQFNATNSTCNHDKIIPQFT